MSRADRFARSRGWLVATLIPLSMPRSAVAADTCRAIEALPATITEPGRHCLVADMRSRIESGAAIVVLADWVTLDLQSHRLSGLAGATAIEAVDRRGVTIVGGTIAGFGVGIRLVGKSGGFHLVDRLRVTTPGVPIRVEGRSNHVRSNRLSRNSSGAAAEARGIVVRGPLSRILDNEVETLGVGAAVEVSQADGAIIEGNVLRSARGAVGAVGIRIVSGDDVLVLRNELRGVESGVVLGGTDADRGQ